jgi:glutamine cyclotransferase
MRDFSYGGYKDLGSGEKEKGDRELSIKDHLIERLEQRFKERQTSLRFITVGSLAMALSACKNDALVQGSDGNDVFGNTSASEIFKGRLGNDVYSYLMSGTDTITDTGGNDELRVSVLDAEGIPVQTSFKRVGNDLVVTQSGEGNSVTVIGAFSAGTALEAMTLVYEDGSRSDQTLDLVGSAEDSPDGNTNIFVGTETADTIESAQSGWFFGDGGNDVITLSDGDDKVYAGDGDDVIYPGLGINELYGEAGDDIILGSTGDDLIVGGKGDDLLSSGDGFDQFVFNTDDGKDVIGVLSSVPIYGINVVNSYPHDTAAFTQGLIYLDGHIYEGTGQRGASSLRKVDLESGDVLQQSNLDAQYFGEGITVFGDKIYQLTWTSGDVLIYDKESFALGNTLSIAGEGWGLTHDGTHLIMSDGSSTLRYLDPETLEVVKSVTVTDGGIDVDRLNELEFINGEVWANVWKSPTIVRIDPESGVVNSRIDLSEINQQTGMDDVLNGIAYNLATDQIFVTGKNWNELYEIEVDETQVLSAAEQGIYLKDFDVHKDSIDATAFNYLSADDLFNKVTTTQTGSILFSDQGTELEIVGLDLDEALAMDITLASLTQTDMGGGVGQSMDDSWCCTASYKRGAMAIKEVKAFRRWHVKKSRVWQEGYHIWGRIVADKWLMKSQWAAKGTQDLFNLIMHKKVTFRGLLAWLVITPPAMLIGSYIVLAQRLDRLLGRTAVRGITG